MSQGRSEESARRRPFRIHWRHIRIRWRSARPWLVGVLLFLIGGVIVSLGGLISGLGGYTQSILLSVGTALGLVAPIYIAERLLRNSVNEVAAAQGETDEKLRQVAATVSELDREFSRRLIQDRTDDEQRLEKVAEGNFEELRDEYNRAAARDWIDDRGLRVQTSVDGLWLLVHVGRPSGDQPGSLEFAFEGADLERIGNPVVVGSNESEGNVFYRLTQELKQAGAWQGFHAVKPSEVLRSLADSLGKIVNLHWGIGRDTGIYSVIEFVGDDWAVTRTGLNSLREPYIYLSESRIKGDAPTALGKILKEHGWDTDSYEVALARARKIHQALRQQDLKRLGAVRI